MDRRYTGTQRLQLVWSLVCVGFIGGAIGLGSVSAVSISVPVLVGGVGVGWLIGLILLGLRERRQWSQMVENSEFSDQIGPNTADIETIIDGRSVSASTTVPSPLAQSHTELRTAISGVDASFTVTLERVVNGEPTGGTKTGAEELDSAFVINGSNENVSRILSEDVQHALVELETPGLCTVTGDHVTFRVPFTALTPAELETISDALVTIASRVEEVGQADS